MKQHNTFCHNTTNFQITHYEHYTYICVRARERERESIYISLQYMYIYLRVGKNLRKETGGMEKEKDKSKIGGMRKGRRDIDFPGGHVGP